ncbi:hypothetical protein ILYODFUR_033011 [Ilyodon furcidens]|uniref:Fibrinogen C-terminal domain-containing protein n=1 Tax=Ilyodon furcidens TaxID=33524 RepID=A0ABV0TSZ2_9TELE
MMKLLSVVFLLLVPMMSRCSKLALPLDCSDVHEKNSSVPSGVYTIYPIGATSAVQVYCDMDSLEGKWTVFQRRMDGSVNFYRPWEEYKMGFGNAAGEYWLGLESLFHLTQRKNYQLLVDMEDFEGKKVYARYSTFSIDSESNGYRLHVSGFTDGGAAQIFHHHNRPEKRPNFSRQGPSLLLHLLLHVQSLVSKKPRLTQTQREQSTFHQLRTMISDPEELTHSICFTLNCESFQCLVKTVAKIG